MRNPNKGGAVIAVRLTLFLHRLYLVILTPLEGQKFSPAFTQDPYLFSSVFVIYNYEIYFMKTMMYETRKAILKKGFPPLVLIVIQLLVGISQIV